ncbi:MAG: glycosyltransferase family 87 protein [Chloroflexota bacterium]
MSMTRVAGAYALLAAMAAAVFAAAILLGPYRAVERSDYMTYHVAARIVLAGDGACLYSVECQTAAQRELIGEEPSFTGGALPYNSPPWFAAVIAPLGVLPLSAGFAVFTVIGLLALACGVWRIGAEAGWERSARLVVVVLVLTAWPTAMAVVRGQSTLLAAGLLALSVGLERYQSGLAMGLSALKPTLGPLWAAWQLIGGHWRAVGAAAAVAVAWLALTAVVVSPQALLDYPAHLVAATGQDATGVHVAEMINWRGVAERLGVGGWLVVGGSLATLAVVAAIWLRTRSRSLGAAAAFLATPLVIPHANQHEFVLATLGILLAVAAVSELRRRLATFAVLLHVVLWTGVLLDAQVSAWLLFGLDLAWLAAVAWAAARYFRPVPVHPGND